MDSLQPCPGKRKPRRGTSGSAKNQKAMTAEAPEMRKRKKERKRGNSASSNSKKRKTDTATARREEKEKKNEKKRKREMQQQTMMEFAHRRPSKRPNHTSREQEVAEEQQSRAQSEYDTG